MTLTVGVVVVTHESSRVLPGFLASLAEHEPDVDVVVVDSGSPSGPPSVPDGVGLIPLADNVGYGTGCNRGVEQLRRGGGAPDVVVCCNPDVRLRGPSLTQLAGELAGRPATGVATGPVIDSDGERIPSAWGATSALRAFAFGAGWRPSGLLRAAARVVGAGGQAVTGASMVADEVEVEGHVLGGAMAVTATCWDALGGFDEGYFLFWEDADLCLRARRAGYEVRVLPCDPIVHHSGTSSEGIVPEQRWGWYLEGAERFADLHLDAGARKRLLAALRLGRRLARSR